MRIRRGLALRLSVALLVLGLGAVLAPAEASHGARSAGAGAAPPRPPHRPRYVPPVKHVFVINIENKGYDETWGPTSAAPYLAKHLRRMGVLLNSYYGTAHNSLPNYLAQISGQAPNPQTQADCQIYTKFSRSGPTQAPGQLVGSGCVYPRTVRTLARQLTNNGLHWKGYMEHMGRSCLHPRLGKQDPTQQARPGHNYAVRHNPFMYFRSITGHPQYCRRHVLPLRRMTKALHHAKTTPNLVYITPDLCHDGHDNPCANGKPGGLVRVNDFLQHWVPRILASPAFRRSGVLIITADESDGPLQDSTSCCGETSGPNTPKPGIVGPGGGKVGALVISRWTKPNTWSTTPYNHYSLLASLEEIFRLPKLGMARQSGLDVFGLDVYNSNWYLG